MRLYEVPNRTFIRLPGGTPIDLLFFHIDGMYSYCEDSKGNIWHICATTEVEILDVDTIYES
jgi:hypothetical protein